MKEQELLLGYRLTQRPSTSPHGGRRLRSWDKELLHLQEPAKSTILCLEHPCMTMIDKSTGRTKCRFHSRGEA